jgi:cytochrome c-type biogenesis protein CcmE
MSNDEKIEALLSMTESLTQGLRDTQFALAAVSTAFIGVLQALDNQPDLFPLIAQKISSQAEKLEALSLGSPVSDDVIQRQTQVLQDLLPPNVRRLVKLPGQP